MGCTFLFVHTEDDDDFVPADTDELLDTSDTSSRKFGKEDHAVDVVWSMLELDLFRIARPHSGEL